MSRLIDADAMKDKARELIPNYHASVVMNLFDLIDNLVDNMPTINNLISRQAAIDALGDIHPLDYNAQAYKARIERLPSAQPETCDYWDSESNYCALNKPSEQPTQPNTPNALESLDCISRQAAIEAIRASASKYTGFMEMEMYTDDDAVEAIEALPSAHPERKKGKWIVISDGYGNGEATAHICECSECKDTIWVYKKAPRRWNYCPNCGARMEDEP